MFRFALKVVDTFSWQGWQIFNEYSQCGVLNPALRISFETVHWEFKHAKISFYCAMILVVFLLYVLIGISLPSKYDIGLIHAPTIGAVVLFPTMIIGFVFTLISLIKKEKSSYFKWIGAFINTALISCFIWILFNSPAGEIIINHLFE